MSLEDIKRRQNGSEQLELLHALAESSANYIVLLQEISRRLNFTPKETQGEIFAAILLTIEKVIELGNVSAKALDTMHKERLR
jgi:hypothetical protein